MWCPHCLQGQRLSVETVASRTNTSLSAGTVVSFQFRGRARVDFLVGLTMKDKVRVNVDIRLIISVLVFFNHLKNETLDASVEISFFLCEDTVIEKVILMGNTAALNRKNPYTVFRRKGQVFLLLPKDHVLLDFFKENNHYMQ